MYFLVEQKKRNINPSEAIKIIIIASLNWGIAYLLTYFIKWVIVDLIYDIGMIKDSFNQAVYRAGGDNTSYIDSLYKNIAVIAVNLNYLLCASVIVTIIRLIINRKRINKKMIISNFLPYAIISIMPLAWYMMLKEHSATHMYFTYRSMLVFLVGAPLTILKISETNKYAMIEDKKEQDIRRLGYGKISLNRRK